MPPCSNVLIRRRIESPRRALLPLIGWASCFKSTSSVPRPPSCLFCSTSHSLSTVALFVPAPQRSPLGNPLPPPAALPFACRRANLRGLCLSCFAAIPSCAPSSSCSSSSFSTQWRVKSVNRRRRQSVLQVAATTACSALPRPGLAWTSLAAALPTSSATLTPWPPSCFPRAGNVLNRKALFQLC